MNNDIVQLTDNSGNNVYPIAGGATQGSISKSMLAEGVFEGPELSPPSSLEYVRTENIVDGAVTSDKIDWSTFSTSLTLGPDVTGSAIATVFGNLVCVQMINIAGITSSDTKICEIPDSLRPTAQFSAMKAVGLRTGGSWQEFNLVLVSQSGNSRIVAQGAPGAMNAGNYIFWYPLA